MFSHKHFHDLTLRRIGKYLKATHLRGLILDIDCYPDDTFSGMYCHKKIPCPSCVQSRNDYEMTVCMIWQSKLQSEALSTIEVEVHWFIVAGN